MGSSRGVDPKGPVRPAVHQERRVLAEQLLVAEEKVCHSCGRRQYLPFAVRRVFRAVGLVMPSVVPGTILAASSMVVGYAIQLRYGAGGFFDPSPGAETYELGSAFPALVMGSQPWRAFTYTMLHGNLMHIAFNGFALLQVGPLVEQAFGSARFGFAWVIGGILAAAIPALLGSQAPMVGASGSVFALIGMALVWGHLAGTPLGRVVRDVMVKGVIYATVFGLLIGNVAHGAHFAGLGVGAALGYLLPPPGRHATRRRLSPVLATAAIGLAVAALIGCGSWFAADRPVPLDLPPQMQLALVYDRGDREGWESVFGSEAYGLLAEARAAACPDYLPATALPAAGLQAAGMRPQVRMAACSLPVRPGWRADGSAPLFCRDRRTGDALLPLRLAR